MPYSIELHFDNKSDAFVRSIWDRLEKECHEKYLPQSGFPPHITLALFDDSLKKDDIAPAIKRCQGAFQPFKMKFSAIGVFSNGKEGSLFLVPAASKQLLEFHETLHADIQLFQDSMIGHYKPGDWVPHCTLSMGTALDNIPSCFQQILRIEAAIEVNISSVHFEEFEF